MASSVGIVIISSIILLLTPFSASSAAACHDFPGTPSTDMYCVDHQGCCKFTTVQAAIDAVPDNSRKRTIIWINTGIYVEKVTLNSKKANVTLQGQGYTTTIITWNDTAASAHGMIYSGSVNILADGFVAKNISFKNSAPAPEPGGVDQQAIAMKIGGDKAAFWGCGFYGNQDTLCDHKMRHYFKECFIEGSIDFIFGDGRSLYEDCTLNSVAKAVPKGQININGAITAQGRMFPENNTGFSFVNCKIQGTGSIALGRAWRAYARVIFAKTLIPDIVAPAGWDNMGDASRNTSVFFAEYDCYGDGSNMAGRVPYAKRLDDTSAQQFIALDYIDGQEWLKPFNDALVFA